MEVTYIGHSGFMMEWESCYWLFDYYKGQIPVMNADKKIIVFASHKHADHYNPEIFQLYNKYKNIEYVLSSDINQNRINFKRMGIKDDMSNRIVSVKPGSGFELFDTNHDSIQLKTLKSTDCGVAFLLLYKGKTIYHAGDLNLWVWKTETKQYNNNMTANFRKEMEVLAGIPIDIAFAPLDPRQEEYYYMGMESLLNTAKIRYVFPMHFWDKTEIIQRFIKERGIDTKNTKILDINQEGQRWLLEDM